MRTENQEMKLINQNFDYKNSLIWRESLANLMKKRGRKHKLCELEISIHTRKVKTNYKRILCTTP